MPALPGSPQAEQTDSAKQTANELSGLAQKQEAASKSTSQQSAPMSLLATASEAGKPAASLSIGNQSMASAPQTSSALASGTPIAQTNLASPAQAADNSRLTSDSTARVQSRLPRVQVDVIGPSSVQVGVPHKYQIVVTNQDQFDLRGLILRLEVPSGPRMTPGDPSHGAIDLEQVPGESSMITWGFDHLAASQVATAPITVVSPTASDFSIGVEWTLMPVSEVAEVHVIAPKLQVELGGSQEVLFGAVNSYQLARSQYG